ncbi:helix-turn-helix domain-containing protein [Amycolatopsis sp. NPDC006131]|uniref:helix-turn-helix domain-containing protein n=1 Tax=Amycolatopsis sp. NPDC006131 TaxID=3156731 RepID=UPI0033B49563
MADVHDLTAVPAAERETRFEELVAETHVDMAVRLGRPAESFRASIRRRRIDDVVLVETACDPCSGRRGPRRAARTGRPYLGVMVVRRGRETVALGDTTADLRPGDVVVWRSDRPARFEVHAPQRKQTLIVPLAALADVPGGHRLFRTVVLDGSAPAVRLFTGYLGVLSHTLDRLGPAELATARSAALDLFSAAAQHDSAPAPLALMEAWIERHLASGEVTPAAIAAAHGMSVRSVYRVFAEAGTTVAAFVRDRRLARARRELATGADPIADIALRWGFADASHFTRAFRARYGCTPRDHRAGAGTNGPPAGRQMQALTAAPGSG